MPNAALTQTVQDLPRDLAILKKYEAFDPEQVLLEIEEAAELTHTDTRGKTLEAWRAKGIELPFVKLGRKVRYRLVDVLEYRSRVFRSSREAVTHDRRLRG